ncbi:MAG TPA: M20/M25/M40 family metallo-hydrolase [Tepidisphaeraceae bacterium]|nr:M20/M25/M40 family metallo-hydrolase [Tepidisphaeraceae bacterium]
MTGELISHLSKLILILLIGSIVDVGPATMPTTAPTTAPTTQPRGAVGLIRAEDILNDVKFLASDALGGRASDHEGGHLAAEWLADQFENAGLEKIKQNSKSKPSYFHPIMRRDFSPNVVGVRRGASIDRFILITAHYDHLAPAKPNKKTTREGDVIYNGADDNASGVAGMLAIARATQDLELDATLVFVGFTGEEVGMYGSKEFSRRPPIQIKKIIAMFNMDMISRGVPGVVYVDGADNADPLRKALRKSNEMHHLGMDIRFDEHPDWLLRSDQAPFLRRGVPAILLSVDGHPDYHQVTDEADRIDPQLAAQVSQLVCGAVIETAKPKEPKESKRRR